MLKNKLDQLKNSLRIRNNTTNRSLDNVDSLAAEDSYFDRTQETILPPCRPYSMSSRAPIAHACSLRLTACCQNVVSDKVCDKEINKTLCGQKNSCSELSNNLAKCKYQRFI